MSNANTSTFAIEKAQSLVLNFRQKFGEGHYWLACHAAFPLALTPELLYTLRANFLFDNHGSQLRSPWIAVADVLLNLCKETGHELYQMDPAVREMLIRELKNNKRFQKGSFLNDRLQQLGHFLLAYVEQHLYSSDENLQTFAEAQSWAALTYINPQEATQKIAQAIAEAQTAENDHEQVRLQLLLDNLLEEHPELNRLRQYAQANVANLGGNPIPAQQLDTQANSGNKIEIAGIPLNNLVVEKTSSPTELQIKILQQGLKTLGFYEGDLTEKMDELTTASVEAFLEDQKVDGSGKSLTFLLREVEEAINHQRGKKVTDLKLKVYLSNSNQLRSTKKLRFLYDPLLEKLKELETKGLIELDYYTKHVADDFTNKGLIDRSRDAAELTLMPINPDLIKSGLSNRKNIAEFYEDKMLKKKSLVVPIVLEDLGVFKDDFAKFPQLPSDGIPLINDGSAIRKSAFGGPDPVQLETMLNDIEALVDRLTHLKRSDPEGKLVFEKSDYGFLFDASMEEEEEENFEAEDLKIFLSYTNPDREEVEQVLSTFRELENYNFIDPEVELEGINHRDIEEERKALLEKADLVLAFLSPDYLASTLHLYADFQSSIVHEETKGNLQLIPILLRPCLTEWSDTRTIGRIPVSGISFSGLSDPKILAEDFSNITQKTIEDKNTKAKGQEIKGLWGSRDFFNPAPSAYPIDDLGKTPKNLLIRYHPNDRAYFDRFVTHLDSFSQYEVFDIDKQEFGISKIDPSTEQSYAIDRADVIINLVSQDFLKYPPFMDSVLQILGNVQSGAKQAFNITLEDTFENNIPLFELPLLREGSMIAADNDLGWVEASRALIKALRDDLEDLEIDAPLVERLIELCLEEKHENLDLSSRKLSEVPQNLVLLSHLKRLDLSSNNLNFLPPFIFTRLPNLIDLNLADNQLESIPEEISQLQKLKEINLSNNRLERLPIELNLIEPLPSIRAFNNPLPIYSKILHDNPEDLFDLILTNQDWVKNKTIEEKIELQTALAKFQKVNIDGKFEELFFDALYNWQVDNNLKPGALDKETVNALLNIDLKIKGNDLNNPIQQQSAESSSVEEMPSNSNDIGEEILDLIGANKIDQAIQLLLERNDPYVQKKTILYAAQFTTLKNNSNSGVISQKEYSDRQNEIIPNLLREVLQYQKEDLLKNAAIPVPSNLPPLAEEMIASIKTKIQKGQIKQAINQTHSLLSEIKKLEEEEKALLVLKSSHNDLLNIFQNQAVISFKDFFDSQNQITQELLDILDRAKTIIESGNFSDKDFIEPALSSKKTAKRKRNSEREILSEAEKRKNAIRDLISSASLKEAFDIAQKNQKEYPTTEDHRVILLSLFARLNRLTEQQKNGIIDPQASDIERNRIIQGLLELLDEIENYFHSA